MPQPLTERQHAGTYWNSLTLRERPECAAGVADVASAWAFLEFRLVHMFFSATGDLELDDDGIGELVGHQLAVAALGSLESLTARLDVIASGIAAYLPDKSDDFEQLRIGIRACAKERNRIVHAVWGANRRYPNDIIRVLTFEDEFIKYTPRDFRDTTNRILAQIDRVGDFDEACRQARFAELSPEQGGPAQ